jgi:hypothetical protein
LKTVTRSGIEDTATVTTGGTSQVGGGTSQAGGGTMRDQLERRLETLRAELAAGKRALEELERKEISLRETMLRISGAVQVLEEELARS